MSERTERKRLVLSSAKRRITFFRNTLQMTFVPESSEGRTILQMVPDPPIEGKKFAVISVVGPGNRRQPFPTFAYKIRDVCATKEEAERRCEELSNYDRFDTYALDVGQWVPMVDDPTLIPDAKYANTELNELISSYRQNKLDGDVRWQEEVDRNLEQIRRAGTKEGQAELAKQKEHVASVLFKIRQLERTIKYRKDELEKLQDIYHQQYNKDERRAAEKMDMPLSEPVPMQYSLWNSGDTGAGASSSA